MLQPEEVVRSRLLTSSMDMALVISLQVLRASRYAVG